MTIILLLKDEHSIFPNLIFLCINICDNLNRGRGKPVPTRIPYTCSAKWAVWNNLKVFFRVSPTRFLSISQNVGKSLKFIQKKLNLQATKGCQPVLGCELGRNRQGDRKIEGTFPRSVLSLKGSGSQIHPWLSPSQGGPQMLPTERTRAESRSRYDSAQGARKPTAVPGQGEGSAAAGACRDSGHPSLRGGGRGRRPLPASSSHRSGRAGGDSARHLPPSSFTGRSSEKS